MPRCVSKRSVMKEARRLSDKGHSRSEALSMAWAKAKGTGMNVCKKSKKRSGKRSSKKRSGKRSKKRCSPRKTSFRTRSGKLSCRKKRSKKSYKRSKKRSARK